MLEVVDPRSATLELHAVTAPAHADYLGWAGGVRLARACRAVLERSKHDVRGGTSLLSRQAARLGRPEVLAASVARSGGIRRAPRPRQPVQTDEPQTFPVAPLHIDDQVCTLDADAYEICQSVDLKPPTVHGCHPPGHAEIPEGHAHLRLRPADELRGLPHGPFAVDEHSEDRQPQRVVHQPGCSRDHFRRPKLFASVRAHYYPRDRSRDHGRARPAPHQAPTERVPGQSTCPASHPQWCW